MKTKTSAFTAITATIGVFIVIVSIIVLYYIFFHTSSKEYKEYILVVEKGDNLYTIAKKLYGQGLIDNKQLFILTGRLLGADKKVVPSAYKVDSTMSIFEIIDMILNERIYTIKVKIVEGATSYDIDRILANVGLTKPGDIIKTVRKKELLEKYNIKSDRLEGYLFPSTYYIPFYYKNKPEKIVEIFVNTFFKKVNRKEYEYLASKVGLTFEQAVILASIIEKEAGIPREEKYLVSSVFHNRLRRKMPLAASATIIYGLMDKNMWHENDIKKWHLTYYTPYNTYLFSGLPKSAIANPSLESLKAAVMPYETDYLFFVSRNDGTHIFTRTYKEHQKYVKIYQIDYWKNRRNSQN